MLFDTENTAHIIVIILKECVLCIYRITHVRIDDAYINSLSFSLYNNQRNIQSEILYLEQSSKKKIHRQLMLHKSSTSEMSRRVVVVTPPSMWCVFLQENCIVIYIYYSTYERVYNTVYLLDYNAHVFVI